MRILLAGPVTVKASRPAPLLQYTSVMFENPDIPLDQLPGAQDLPWKSLHPDYVRCLRLQHLLVVLGPIIGAIIFTVFLHAFVIQTILLWMLVLGFTALMLSWPAISVPRRGYVVRDMDIVFRSGVIFRSVTAIPYNRIQHVETSNTPFDRKYGLATLQLFTAGGSGGDLKIDGLDKDIAEKLRLFLLDKAGASIENA